MAGKEESLQVYVLNSVQQGHFANETLVNLDEDIKLEVAQQQQPNNTLILKGRFKEHAPQQYKFVPNLELNGEHKTIGGESFFYLCVSPQPVSQTNGIDRIAFIIIGENNEEGNQWFINAILEDQITQGGRKKTRKRRKTRKTRRKKTRRKRRKKRKTRKTRKKIRKQRRKSKRRTKHRQ